MYDSGSAQGSYGAYAAEGYNGNTVVNACIREVATSVAMPTLRLMRDVQDGGRVEVKNPTAFLLDHPSESQDQADFVEMMVVYLNVSGNAYVHRMRNGGGRIVALHLLRPDRVQIKLHGDGTRHYEYTIDGSLYQIAAADVEHLKLPNPYDDLYGLSPLQVAAKYVNLDGSIASFLRAYFANAGVPAGILKVSKRINSQQEADVARDKWRSSFGGPRGWHGIAVLDEDASYQQVAPNIKDMDTSAVSRSSETRICAAFGVPPILIGVQSGLEVSTYSNYAQAREAFWDETVSPLVRRVAAFMERVLEVGRNDDVEVFADFAGVRAYEEDSGSLSTRTVEQFNAGVITLNEARGSLGLDPVAAGDVRRVPFNVVEVSPDEMIMPRAAPDTLALSAGLLADSVLKAQALPRSIALGERLLAERDEMADEMEAAVQRYFNGLRSRVAGILGRMMQRATENAKIAPDELTVEMLFPAAARNELATLLGGSYRSIIQRTWQAINESGVAGTLEFDDRNPIVSQIMALATNAATGIDGVTRTGVSRTIEIGIERGYSIQQVARGVPADGFPGIRSIVEETYQNRSRTIARTEVMRAQNAASIGYYREQGITFMRAHDPDGDPNDDYIATDGRTCIERNGQNYTSDDAMDVVSHPNCRLTWTPLSLTQVEEMGLSSRLVMVEA
ncbi:MAG: phage portal protein [Acidobacteria bacterium]|nr:phage portal protein [Acidobacteriota bacterium]